MLHIPEQANQHRYNLKFTAHPVAHLVKEARILVPQSLLRITVEGITIPQQIRRGELRELQSGEYGETPGRGPQPSPSGPVGCAIAVTECQKSDLLVVGEESQLRYRIL